MVLGESFWTWGALLRLQMQSDFGASRHFSLRCGQQITTADIGFYNNPNEVRYL